MTERGCSFDDKIHQMIWSCSLLKWLSIHALGFSYGDQISVLKGISDAHIKVDARTKDDACMAQMMMWHEFKITIAL